VGLGGRALSDRQTIDQYKKIYADIKEMLDDPNLGTYAPNILGGYGMGGNGLLSQQQQFEIVNSGTSLITYLEAVLDSNSSQTVKSSEKKITPYNIFISHGKKSEALDLLTKFIYAIGLIPVVVMEQSSQGMSLDDKVLKYMQTCETAIILATGDDKVNGTLQPRLNVIHEIGLAQHLLTNKITYLLEEGTEFPSNISPKVYERFTKNNLSKAFITIARDLRSFGIL
jgi:predicted nucleotide-binding protein